jgi:hypothetical protein
VSTSRCTAASAILLLATATSARPRLAHAKPKGKDVDETHVVRLF